MKQETLVFKVDQVLSIDTRAILIFCHGILENENNDDDADNERDAAALAFCH